MLPLGKHLIRIEGDTLFMVTRGVVTGDEMVELFGRFDEIKREHGMLFVLFDSRLNTGMEPQARKFALEQTDVGRGADLQVLFGASFGVRVIINMILSALKLLGKKSTSVYMMGAESEARAFFEQERERVRRELKKSP